MRGVILDKYTSLKNLLLKNPSPKIAKKALFCYSSILFYSENINEGVDRGGGGTGVEGAESGVEGAESGMEGVGSGGRGGGKRG